MATVKFYLDHPKENGQLKKNEVPVLVKFSIDRDNRFELSTKERVVPRAWDFRKQEVKASFIGHVETNLSLAKIKNDLIQLWRDNKAIDIAELKKIAKSLIKYGQPEAPEEKKTFSEARDKFLAQYESDKDKKTVQKYQTLFSKISSFNPDLDFKDIDFNFYDNFKAFLHAEPNPNYEGMVLINRGDYYDIVPGTGPAIGLLNDTVYKYLDQVCTFLRWATDRGYEVSQSFEKWEIIKYKHKPISLSLKELEQLERTEMSSPVLDVARDYLVLECRTGQRISDIRRFDLKDYYDYKWTFHPKKGNNVSQKKVTVHFKGYCQKALMILAKYGFQPPKISEGKLNKYIKQVCQEAGINQHIQTFRMMENKRIRIQGPKYEFVSTHTGRKTFITIALQFMPPKVVMNLTGIESYETLKHYDAESDHSVIEEYLNTVQDNITLMRKAQ
jgi:integrase